MRAKIYNHLLLPVNLAMIMLRNIIGPLLTTDSFNSKSEETLLNLDQVSLTIEIILKLTNVILVEAEFGCSVANVSG